MANRQQIMRHFMSEPFSESNLGANATPDFLYYNSFCVWKEQIVLPLWMLMQKTYNV